MPLSLIAHLKRRARLAALLACGAALLTGCGGGGGPPPPMPPPPSASLTQISGSSPFAANCDDVPANGTLYLSTSVEPSLAVNPTSPLDLAGIWQQDRWSTGGSHGDLIASSTDGGQTWTTSMVPFSRCTGGTAANGGDFERATDPWVSFGPSGTVYALALVFSGGTLAPGSSSAMRVSQSSDGGASWSAPQTLIEDGEQFFNDKGSITADPTDEHYVYVVWDRLDTASHGTSELARSTDGGATWEVARVIYDPGANDQTIGNIVVVLPSGMVLDVFSEIDTAADGSAQAALRAIRSSDHGATWSAPLAIAEELGVGVTDPNTGASIRDAGVLPSIATDAAGMMYVVWQDARFSSGARDGVALSHSSDGGTTWSTPAEINAAMQTQAFVPIVHVSAEGVIGVTYYDFRNATGRGPTLPTDYWLVTSSDALNWTESHLTGPFDLELAPQDGGLFLGDYQSLASTGGTFLPFFAKTNAAGAMDPSAIYVAFSRPSATSRAAQKAAVAAPSGVPGTMSAAWRQRVSAHLARVRRARLVGRMH